MTPFPHGKVGMPRAVVWQAGSPQDLSLVLPVEAKLRPLIPSVAAKRAEAEIAGGARAKAREAVCCGVSRVEYSISSMMVLVVCVSTSEIETQSMVPVLQPASTSMYAIPALATGVALRLNACRTYRASMHVSRRRPCAYDQRAAYCALVDACATDAA